MNIVFRTTPLALHHWGYILAVMVGMFLLGRLIARLIGPII
jgi:hypothetical protein